MQKYSLKTKLEIVKIYNRGETGIKHLAKLYGTNKVSVRTWMYVYNNLGIKGLRPLKKSPTYSFEFKKNIVKLYLKGNIFYMDLIDRFKLKDPSPIKG